MLLPPQVLLHLWPEGGEEVIRVHDDVHKRVDPTNEGAMSAGIILGAAPADHGHHSVMVHMQECHLTIVLAQHKENRIEQLGYLGQIVNIHNACLAVCLGGARPIDGLATPAIVLPDHKALVHHPHTQGHLKEVIDQQGAFQFKWFAITHKARSPRQDKVLIKGQYGEQRQR